MAAPIQYKERFAKTKKEKEDKEILEKFSKVEVNLPLLEAIEQILKYAKFLIEVYTNRRKLSSNKRVSLEEIVSAIIQRKLPPKCKDQRIFAILCKISTLGIRKFMCDLGTSINVILISIYSKLNTGQLKEMGVIIQLVDKSIVYPEGVLEDVLVQVNNLISSVDFYVLDLEDDKSQNFFDLLLGRPFLISTKTKIDV